MRTSALGRRLGASAILALGSLLAIDNFSPFVWAQSGAASKEQSARSLDEASERGRALGKELLARGIPGLAMAVAVDGKIVFSEGFGYADMEERAPVWPETKFRIGSISKPLTATAVVQLVAQGKLDLDAPVQKYVPSFPAKGATITPRMIAGHLGGIRHYQGDEFNIQKHYENVLESLKIFQDDPLVAPPGTQFNYSSYGYNLLSAVVESASGEDFLAYMENHVFVPLSLRHTVADRNSRIIELRSRFYEQQKDKPLENAPYVDYSYKWAGGGFLSSAEDLVQFGSALLQPGFLNADSLALLFTSQKTKDGKETGYGIGWNIRKAKSGQRIYEHSGGSVGGHCQLILYPDSRVVVALVTNLSNAPWDIEEVESVAEAFANKTR